MTARVFRVELLYCKSYLAAVHAPVISNDGRMTEMQFKKAATAAVFAAMLMTPVATSAQAAPTSAIATPEIQASKTSNSSNAYTVADLDEATIKTADKFIKKSGTSVSFDESAASDTLSADQMTKVKSAVSLWNSNVASTSMKSTSATDTSTIAASAGGNVVSGAHGYVSAHWWGLEIHLDSYLAGKVIAGTATGAGIAALVGLATAETAVGGVAGAVVAAALGVASGATALCQDVNGAVTYYVTPVNPTNPVCNPFA